MNDENASLEGLRAGLIDGLRATRAAERDVFAALDPDERDRPADDGGWSAKDVQAHLSAWKRRTVERLAAIRNGTDEPTESETDEVNAVFHAERAGWSWEDTVADAETTTTDLIAAVQGAALETLGLERVSGTIMGNGPEHALTHLPPIAARAGQPARVAELADSLGTILDDDVWPTRAAAYARYNLACYRALAGDLDAARGLLRRALPADADLRGYAPSDDDLVALRDEIPSLAG